MEVFFHFPLNSYSVIATKFCTWHDSRAVVACAKFVAIFWPTTEVSKQGEFSIEFEMRANKSLVKRAPGTRYNFMHWSEDVAAIFYIYINA